MPLPAILGLAALGAAALGIGAQMDAKETNERAQEVADEAKDLYNNSKRSLEVAQRKTETSLLNLGHSKKQVLETSVNQFLIAYERIKNIELSESVGLDEIKNFTLEKQDVLQLREMSDIYQSTFSSGTAGAATGAVIALAASGSLPVVTGTLSVAGTALVAGEIGMAAGLAGSALSFGAAMTPLAAIAAPAMLFSGISASIKADENLEKAQTMYAEAEAASEQMKTSEVLCEAIADRADMFDNLLNELNEMFSYCTAMLDGVTKKKMGVFKNKTVDAKTFTEDERKLVAVTRSLAGAVKAVIDTPILTSEGVVSDKSESVYNDAQKELPALSEAVSKVKEATYSAKPVAAKTLRAKKTKKFDTSLGIVRNVFAIFAGIFMIPFAQGMFGESLTVGMLGFAIMVLLIMNNDVHSGFFKLVKNIGCITIAVSFCIMFYKNCQSIVYMNYYIIGSIIVGIISMIVFGVCIPSKEKKTNNLKRTLARIFGCIFFFAIAVLVYAFLHKFIGISHTLSAILTSIIYAFFSFASVYSGD
ncbi:MAG: hypothetical protein Q4A78_10690 [Peptostreptococcaceae bacterium]|nr:hypothetical protein [Peptostreptococcaceae bacterium]